MSSGAGADEGGRGRPRAVRRATTVPSRGGIAPPPGSTRDPLSSSQHGGPGPGGGRQGRRLTTIGVAPGGGGIDDGGDGPPANIHSRAASMGFPGGTGSDSGTAATASTTKSSIPDGGRGGRHAFLRGGGSAATGGGGSALHLSMSDATDGLHASASDLIDEDDQRANLEALAQYNEEGGGNNPGENEEFYEDIYPTLHNLNELLADAARKRSAKLPSTLRSSAGGGTGDANAAAGGGADQISLDDLLGAANKDVESYRERLSQLRMRMYGGQVTKADVTAMKLAQMKRRADHEDTLTRLRNDAAVIVQQLQSAGTDVDGEKVGGKNRRGVTQSDLRREKMARWQRALELYVLAPEAAAESSISSASGGGGAGAAGGSGARKKFDLLHLLDKLCENCDKEEELSEALTEASGMCNTLVDVTATAVRDAAEFAAETEDAYHIRLEAFSAFVETVAEDTERIGERFRTNGRAAMKIGQQLELAERRRRQCETASVLLRRWWMMESLAEEEADNPRGEINVNEEVCGKIPHSSCRMDPLFTQPRNGLEAARALKALRAVVRARGTSSTSPTAAGSPPVTPTAVGGSPTSAVSGGIMLDPQSASRRFDLTSNLIHRTSAALESRLLNSFLEIHAAGGTYDFVTVRTKLNPVTKGNVLDWVTLRELAEALHTFDGGRKLHKRYVQQVITTKFPELFYFAASPNKNKKESSSGGGGGEKKKHGGEDSSSEEEMELDLDETRTQLSALFHRVSEVCREEFALIAHVFSPSTLPDHRGGGPSGSAASYFGSEMPDATPFQVARALLQRIINDPRSGLAARINELLESVDRNGDFDAGAKKLDTFVVVHEKAAGLFYMLREAAESCLIAQGGGGGGAGGGGGTGQDGAGGASSGIVGTSPARQRAVTSLLQFLTAQQTALSNGQRRGYLNLELRLLHHECCATFDRIGAKLTKLPSSGGRNGGRQAPTSKSRAPGDATFDHYRAPLLPIDKDHLKKQGVSFILNGPMKPTTIRQPLIHATDSLARARLMFGGDTGTGGGEGDSTARVITAIYNQMCVFYGDAFLCPVIECLGELLERNPPSTPPSLPFNEDQAPHNLGVDGNFWIGVERVNSAAKAFDRELWAEQRAGSARVWEILVGTGSQTSLTLAKERRLRFFRDIEERGEAAMLRALDAISAHIQWIVIAGESMLATGGNRLLQNLTTQDKGGGPYAVPAGSSLEATNSPAVQSLTFCLRAQFVSIQAALTPQSLSAFWTALSRRLYDIVCARLLLHYYVSNIGAVIFSRDVEALRAVAMLAGTDHSHWDTLKELLTLYMTPPDALKTILVGPEGDIHSGKGLFNRAGQDQSLVFMSRRIDFRNKTNTGLKTSEWATNLLSELGVPDPSERNINVALYSAERKV